LFPRGCLNFAPVDTIFAALFIGLIFDWAELLSKTVWQTSALNACSSIATQLDISSDADWPWVAFNSLMLSSFTETKFA
jgi:hypothetical protein